MWEAEVGLPRASWPETGVIEIHRRGCGQVRGQLPQSRSSLLKGRDHVGINYNFLVIPIHLFIWMT
jgi:hypothetical protein